MVKLTLTLDELNQRLGALGEIPNLQQLKEDQLRHVCISVKGALVNYWPSTGTVNVQNDKNGQVLRALNEASVLPRSESELMPPPPVPSRGFMPRDLDPRPEYEVPAPKRSRHAVEDSEAVALVSDPGKALADGLQALTADMQRSVHYCTQVADVAVKLALSCYGPNLSQTAPAGIRANWSLLVECLASAENLGAQLQRSSLDLGVKVRQIQAVLPPLCTLPPAAFAPAAKLCSDSKLDELEGRVKYLEQARNRQAVASDVISRLDALELKSSDLQTSLSSVQEEVAELSFVNPSTVSGPLSHRRQMLIHERLQLENMPEIRDQPGRDLFHQINSAYRARKINEHQRDQFHQIRMQTNPAAHHEPGFFGTQV